MFLIDFYKFESISNEFRVGNDDLNLKAANYWNLTGTPIFIDDTQVGTYDWATINATYDWCNGAGTNEDPYIIENIIIDGLNTDNCIEIWRSSVYFIIRNCTLYNSNDSGMYLNDVFNAKIHNNTCHSNVEGIRFQNDGDDNVWDNGTVGNYWDDYSGADDDDDGIGDTPYADIGGKVGAQDNFPIWWDPPRFSIISPIDNQKSGGVAPSFVIEIEAGVPDYMWYTLGTSPTKYFFVFNNSINQAAWDAISSDTITITFFVNDSAGLIASDEAVVRIDRTTPTVSGFSVLIVFITIIVSLVGVSWKIRKKR